jgi:prepilin-type processing-associated H-X9-DG protein
MVQGDAVIRVQDWASHGATDTGNNDSDGVNGWTMSDIGPEAHAMFGFNCNDPNISWDDNHGQFWLGNCEFEVNGVTREYFQPPSQNFVPTQRNWWNIYPVHAGGVVNVLLGDGSVQAINNNIDIFVWSAMLTPRGKEPVSGVN